MPAQYGAGGSGGVKKAREGRGGRGGGAGGATNSARATAAAAAAGASTLSRPGAGGAGGAGGRRANVGVGQGRRGPFVYRGEFKRDVKGLMFAFGDSQEPDPQSVALMEDMAVSFLLDLVRRARPTPNQLPIPGNAQQVASIVQADAEQTRMQQEQQRIDDAAVRAAAGNSALAKVQVQRRAAAAAEEHAKRQNERPIRTAVHPFVGRTRLTVDDVKFACRKDAKMTSRIEELIYLDKEIASAKRVFDVPADDAIQQENSANSGGPS